MGTSLCNSIFSPNITHIGKMQQFLCIVIYFFCSICRACVQGNCRAVKMLLLLSNDFEIQKWRWWSWWLLLLERCLKQMSGHNLEGMVTRPLMIKHGSWIWFLTDLNLYYPSPFPPPSQTPPYTSPGQRCPHTVRTSAPSTSLCPFLYRHRKLVSCQWWPSGPARPSLWAYTYSEEMFFESCEW